MFWNRDKSKQHEPATRSKLTYEVTKKSSKSSTKPKTVEKQVNLKTLSGEELDLWMLRISWLTTHGAISSDVFAEIIEKNAKDRVVNVMMDESLFAAEATIVFLYADGPADDEETAIIPYYQWVELPEREKESYPYPIIRFYNESTGVDVVYEAYDDGEDGEVAVNFAIAFWQLADVFTDYQLFAGKESYTLDFKENMPKNNRLQKVLFGINENSAKALLEIDLTDAKLKAMPKKKRRKFLKGLQKLLTALLEMVDGAIRNEYGLGGADGPEEENANKKSILDYLLKISETWDNEGSRVTLRNRVNKARNEGNSDEQIIKNFKLAKRYLRTIENIERDLAEGKDPLWKIKKKTPEPAPKPAGPTDPPKSEEDEGEDPDVNPYEAEAYHRTIEEWGGYFYTENGFRNMIKKGDFDELKKNKDGSVKKLSIFNLAAFYQTHKGEVPNFIGDEIRFEIERIER